MLILGLDIATYKSGWAVIETGDDLVKLVDYGLIDLPTQKKVKLGERVYMLKEELSRIMEKFRPDQIIIEDAHIRFVKTAKSLLKTHGAVLVAAWEYAHQEITYITPAKVRGILRCKDKDDVRNLVNQRFGLALTKEQEDISDAIGVGWAGYSLVGAALRKKRRK